MKPSEFEQLLLKRSASAFGRWHKVDLHNHSPSSFDYAGDRATAAVDSARRLREAGVSIAMFTDHGCLPAKDFVDQVSRESGTVVLRGIELNIFVDAWGMPREKVGKNAYFHLLVGFDPNETAEYWVEHIYRECGREERRCGSDNVVGVAAGVRKVLDLLVDAPAICIPAHLHSTPDAFRTRSIDDIFDDPEFLSLVPRFSALEVTNLKTALFFDGAHKETNCSRATCVRSSDAHRAEDLGSRPTWVQMERPSFSELKAALELPFRVSLEMPSEPEMFVQGLHIDGAYLKDLWIQLSPHCNVLIGVKGSGKTAVLECLRFGLGTDVPRANQEHVRAHLQHVLGPSGVVTLLVKRSDGTKVLFSRSASDPSHFTVSFEDGRVERFTRPEALGFPASVLGWHEIEHAAVDAGIRRQYMDAISGREVIRQLEAETLSLAEQIRFKHEQAASRYKSFRELQRQTDEQEQLRRGLQALADAKLIELRDNFDQAIAHRAELKRLSEELPKAATQVSARAELLVPIDRPVLHGSSPLDSAVTPIRDRVEALLGGVRDWSQTLSTEISTLANDMKAQAEEADSLFSAFSSQYEAAVATLNDDQRRLLEAHRRVLEQTQALPALRAQRDQVRSELEQLLIDLIALCGEVTARLNRRSDLRRAAIQEFAKEMPNYGVRLEVTSRVRTQSHDDYQSRYREGYRLWDTLKQGPGPRETLHQALRSTYEGLLADLLAGDALFFSTPEFSHYFTLFEDDDLSIAFDPEGTGETYRAIDQLSAGQRCTAFFPILLRLRCGPLVIDQPEDNLDNRHIATRIAPVLLEDKRARQILLTSHNANLVVLSDPESIAVFEGRGQTGHLSIQGFLATSTSDVTASVLDILDGGRTALDLRYRKYRGVSAPPA